EFLFPVIWMAIISFGYLLLKSPRWVIALVILSYFPISADLWHNSESRFRFWPQFVVKDFYQSELVTFVDFPFFRWYFLSPVLNREICFYLPGGGSPYSISTASQFLRSVIKNPKI